MTERVTPPAQCFVCERTVRPAVKCVSTLCPFEREVRFGAYVLRRPLTKRFIT